MLRIASEDSPVQVVNRLMRMSRNTGFFVGAPLRIDDARYRPRPGLMDTLERGAELVCRRGAHQCLRCGAPLASGNRDLYCLSHEHQRGERDRDKHDALKILRDAAEELGFESPGVRGRRKRLSRAG
jgi:hypothetical protein